MKSWYRGRVDWDLKQKQYNNINASGKSRGEKKEMIRRSRRKSKLSIKKG